MTEKSNDKDLIQSFDPVLALEHYTNLENEFLRCLKYVPLKKDHYDVWSLPFGDLLNNTGSIVDSLLKNLYNSDVYRAQVLERNSDGSLKNNMKAYRQCFETVHHLSQKTIFDLYNYSPLSPFSEWKDEKSPGWWSAYTMIKHDRFRNQEKATLKTVLEALGALFLLNATIPETRMILIQRGRIYSHKVDLVRLIDIMQKEEPLKTDQIIYTKTPLFGYVYEYERQKFLDHTKISILSPWYSVNHS